MAIRKGVHHIAMNVKDFDETIRFYTEALGCTLIRRWPAENPGAAMIDLGGGILEIFKKDITISEGEVLIPHFALVSDDVDGDFQNALKYGAKPQTEPKEATIPSEPPLNVRLAFFVGINGEVVELFQEK